MRQKDQLQELVLTLEQIISCLSIQGEVDLVQGTEEWHKQEAGMGQMDVASASEVISGLGRQNKPVDRDSPEVGAFAEGEH